MDKIKSSALFKIISSVLIFTFISLDISYAYPPEHNSANSTLSTPSLMQQQPMTEAAAALRNSMLSESSVIASLYDIGEYFFSGGDSGLKALPDEYAEDVVKTSVGKALGASGVEILNIVPVDYLKKTVPEKLYAALKEIGYSGKLPDEGVVFVLFKKDGKRFLVQMARKGDASVAGLPGYDWAVSDKYLVKYLPENYRPESEEPAGAHVATQDAARFAKIFHQAGIIPSYTVDISRPENMHIAGGRYALDGIFAGLKDNIQASIETSCDSLSAARQFVASPFYKRGLVTYHLRRITQKGVANIMNLADPSVVEVIGDPEGELYKIVSTLQPAYVSIHLGWPVEKVLLGVKNKHDMPEPGSAQIPEDMLADRIVKNLRILQHNLALAGYKKPILLETLDYHEGGAYEFVTDPGFIRKVIEGSGARLLIDFGHLLCSAKNSGIYEPDRYMEYVRAVVNEQTIGLIDEFHIAVPEARGPTQYEDIHRPLTSVDTAGREFREIMRYCFELRARTGVRDSVIVNFETGIANAKDEIRELAAALDPEAASQDVTAGHDKAGGAKTAALVEARKIAGFLALRDELPAKADLLMAFGNEYLQTVFEAARLYAEGRANAVMLVGGVGHSTANLVAPASRYLGKDPAAFEVIDPDTQKKDFLPEAVIMKMIFDEEMKRRGYSGEEISNMPVYLEDRSRNCGENVTNAGARIEELNKTAAAENRRPVKVGSVILIHMPHLSMRMDRTFRRWQSETVFKNTNAAYNHAAFIPGDAELADPMYQYALVREAQNLENYPELGYTAPLRIDGAAPGKLPQHISAAVDSLESILGVRVRITAGARHVANLVTSRGITQTSMNSPIQVEKNIFKKGASLARFSAEGIRQAALYIKSGAAKVRIRPKNAPANDSREIPVAAGDIITVFADSDVEFTSGSSEYLAFRQTKLPFRLPSMAGMAVDLKQLIAGEPDSGAVRKIQDKNGAIVAESYRGPDGELQAVVHKSGMSLPEGMSMLTPDSAAIGVGVKKMKVPEKTHRHEREGLSKQEMVLCMDGTVRARVADRNGKGTKMVGFGKNDLLMYEPDSVHGIDVVDAAVAVIIQDPFRGKDTTEKEKHEVETEEPAGDVLRAPAGDVPQMDTPAPQSPAKPQSSDLAAGADETGTRELIRMLGDAEAKVRQAARKALDEMSWAPSNLEEDMLYMAAQVAEHIGESRIDYNARKWVKELDYPRILDIVKGLAGKSAWTRADSVVSLARLSYIEDLDELIVTGDAELADINGGSSVEMASNFAAGYAWLRWSLRTVEGRIAYSLATCDWETLSNTGAPAVAALINALEEASISTPAEETIVHIGSSAIPVLIPLLKDTGSSVRMSAAKVLHDIGWKAATSEESIAYLFAANRWDELAAIGSSATPVLIGGLTDTDPSIRKSSAYLLGGIKDPAAIEPLIKAMDDADSSVRMAAAKALDYMGWKAATPEEKAAYLFASSRFEDLVGLGVSAVPFITKVLDDADQTLRLPAIAAAASQKDRIFTKPMIKAMDNEDIAIRRVAAQALLDTCDPNGAEVLAKALLEEDESLRTIATAALRRIGPSAVRHLVKTFGSAGYFGQYDGARENIIDIITGIGPDAVPVLIGCLNGTNEREKVAALTALGNIKDPKAFKHLVKTLRGNDKSSSAAASALGRLGDLRAVEPLLKSFRDHPEPAARSLLMLNDPRLDFMRPYLEEVARDRGYDFSGSSYEVLSAADIDYILRCLRRGVPINASYSEPVIRTKDVGVPDTFELYTPLWKNVAEKAAKLTIERADDGAVPRKGVSAARNKTGDVPRGDTPPMQAQGKPEAADIKASGSATQLFDIVEEAAVNNRFRIIDLANKVIVDLLRNSLLPSGSGISVIDRTKPTAFIKQGIDKLLEVTGGIDKAAIPADIKANIDTLRKEVERIEADSVIANVIAMARRARHENQRLIIGLDTGWIPGYNRKGDLQHSAMVSVIREVESLGDTLRSMGLDNVTVIREDTEALAGLLLAEAGKTGTKLSNVIVLGSNAVLNSASFAALRSAEGEERAFLAAVDPAELTKYAAGNPASLQILNIELIKMLSIAIELAAGKEPPQIPLVMSYDKKLRIVVFLPKAEPMDYEALKTRYMSERAALSAA